MDFKGRLKVAGAGGAGIAADLRLDDIYLELWSEGEELGVWRLDVVEVNRSAGNRFSLDLDGEAMEFEATDPLGFTYDGLTFINEVAGKLHKKRRTLRKGEDSKPLRGARVPGVEKPAGPVRTKKQAEEPAPKPIGARLEQARAGGRYEPLPPAEPARPEPVPPAEPARSGIGAFLAPVEEIPTAMQSPPPSLPTAPELPVRSEVPMGRVPALEPVAAEPVAPPMVIIEEVGAFSWAADVVVEPWIPEPVPVSAPEPVVEVEPEPVALVPEPVAVLPEPEPVALVPEPEPVAVLPEPEPVVVVVPEPVAVLPEPEPEVVVPEPEPVVVVLPEPVAELPEPEPVVAIPEPEPVVVVVPEPVVVIPEPEPVVLAPEPEWVSGALEPVFGSDEMVVFDREPIQKGRLRRGSRVTKKASANGSGHSSEPAPVGFAESPTELDLTPVLDVGATSEIETEFRERGRHATNAKGRTNRRRKPDDHNHEYDIARTVGGLTRRICVHCGHVSFDSEDVYQGWG